MTKRLARRILVAIGTALSLALLLGAAAPHKYLLTTNDHPRGLRRNGHQV